MRFLKFAIPAGALIGGIAVAAVAILDPFRSVEGLSIGPVSLSGTQITMESPRLTGFRDGTRPYEVTATVANQDVRQPNLVELKDLRARIVTDDRGSTARLEANTGLLDTQKEHLELHDQVRLTTEAGERIELNSASVDFKAGTVMSSEPVTVTLGSGVIHANGLEVKDSGKIMHFQGRVRTVFDSEIGRSPERSSESNPEQPTAAAQ